MIYPTNKTVPLAKDLASSSTFTQSLGISSARTDLDTILSAIDAAIYTEQQARISGDSTNATNLTNHINSGTAHAASAITNTPSGNLAATDVQAALNELQSDIDTRALNSALSSEVSRATNAESLLQTELDGERAPLRMTATGSSKTVSIAAARQSRTNAAGQTSSLIVPNGSLISDFPGATIDFSAGTITYTGGSPSPGSFTPISFSGQASKYAKYAIVLLPGSPNTILVLNGTSYGASATAASEPAFSGGVLIGFVTVRDDGSAGTGTINNIALADVSQAIASGSGSGSGSGSPLDPQEDETFVYYTRSDFSVDTNTFVGSTTGTDQTLGLGKITLNATQTFTSTDLTGAQVRDDALAIDQVQARLLYNTGKVDYSPTIQVTRDGGSSWATMTNTIPASVGNTIVGDYIFPTSTSALYDGGTANGSLSSGVRVAAIFQPSYRSTISSVAMYVRTSATAGSVVAKLMSVSAGTPQVTLATSAETLYAGSDITSSASYKRFSFTPITLTAGTQYAIVLEGTGLNANISVDQVTSAPSYSVSSATHNGSGWSASANKLAFQAYGTGCDLRIRVTSGTAGSELKGFGVNYVAMSTVGVIGAYSYEERTITYTEASTGNIVLNSVRYTPGMHQLQAYYSGHVLIAPDFVETGYNSVSFPANFLQAGDTVRFVTTYGLIDGSSMALTKINAMFDAVVGSAAQVSAGVATHSSLQSAINAYPTGNIRLLNTYSTSENISVTSSGITIEGEGYGSQINGTLTLSAAVNYATVKNLRITDNITLACSASFIRECFLAAGKTLTDSGTANSKLIIQE